MSSNAVGLFSAPYFGMNTTGASTYTNYSNEIVSVTMSGGARKSSDTNVLDVDDPVVVQGKREPTEFTVRALYTATSAGLWNVVHSAIEAGSFAFIRYAPGGSAAGRYHLTTSGSAVFTGAPYVSVEAGSGDPIMFEFTVRAPGVTAGSF